MTEEDKILWDFRLHAEVIFNNRINFFLVSQSFLIGAFVALLRVNDHWAVTNYLLDSVVIAGIVLCAIFLYVGHNLYLRIGDLQDATSDLSPVLVKILEARKMTFSSNSLLGVVVPGFFFIGWGGLLCLLSFP